MMAEELQKLDNKNADLFSVLKNSLYVGAQDESVKMVLNYCKAAGLDPMQKPVHIVPMYCSTGKKGKDGKDIKAMRDVVMPGIGLYRIQASRDGTYAGANEPEYGDEVSEKIGDVEIRYPKWCKVTVKRLLKNGSIAEFTAIEFWKENYANKGRGSIEPNAMWTKRPYGQIAKCAEAQALRKAFPEIGSQPTADEMEGKEIDITEESILTVIEEDHNKLPECSDEKFMEREAEWKHLVSLGRKADDLINQLSTKTTLTEAQKEKIKSWELSNENA